ncbi:hypothetical protein Tco_1264521 [Tanacetum coccineum]
MSFGVATLRALVHVGDQTSRDARSWCMISGDAKSRNICNNDKNLSEIQLEHKKEDELVAVVVKVVHELGCMMVVKEIGNGLLEEVEKLEWWFEQDIDDEGKEDEEGDGGEI